MMSRNILFSLSLLLLVGIGAMAAGNDEPKYNPSQKEFYLNEADLAFVQPGLNIKIQSVAVSGDTVSATFKITDDTGAGLDRAGVDTLGTVSTSWILARINPGDTQYSAYRTNSAGQPSTDAGGSYVSMGNGVYKYTFGTKLPSGYPAGATHTVGVYSTRDLRTLAEQLGLFQLVKTGRYISNDTYNFVPSGGTLTVVRDVVRTEACNQCHDPLALHGGARQITQLCILCHQPQNTDPDTGNTVDFKVMIHKIHQGAFLPSVMNRKMNALGTSGSGTGTTATGATPAPIAEGVVPAGKPYQIIGFNNSVHDYSSVVWPQDTRNCTTCHQGGSQSDNYKTNPSRAACGSCHDNVDFALGTNHPGGIQTDDNQCTICHAPDGVEFDLSVTGVHTIPAKSKKLEGLKLTITGVTGTTPGSKPTVSFTVADAKGNPVDATKLNSLAFVLAGPTTDYTMPSGRAATENALSTVKPSGSGFSYTFTAAIPANAKGTFAVGGQAYRLVSVTGSLLGQSFAVREVANNAISYFSVDGSTPAARRTVVGLANCNTCHKTLALHGGTRTDTQYCVICHNPKALDTGETPSPTVNFRTHIHRIHTGEELENEWTVGRNYNGLLFPGDRRNCAKCHTNDSYELPLPDGLVFADNPSGFFTPWGPAASACLGCHDGEDAAAHAFLQTAVFPSGKTAESCAVCHEEGADFSVSRVHAR